MMHVSHALLRTLSIVSATALMVAGMNSVTLPVRAAGTVDTWACSVGDSALGCSSTTLAPLPVPGTGLSAVTGRDGRIYVIGGYNRISGYLHTVQVYDPRHNTWTMAASRPNAIASGAATVGLDGRIYALGGCNYAACPSAVAEVYTPLTNSWSAVAPMPTARYFLTASTGFDGRIYVIGGQTSQVADIVDAYTPWTNTWARVASMPVGLVAPAAARGRDGRIYVGGGLAANSFGSYGFSATMEAFMPRINTATIVASMPTARASLAAATGFDGRIYAMGGYNRISPDGNTVYSLAANEAYTPRTNTWTRLAPMPTARSFLATTATFDGHVYAIGGSVSDNSTGLNTLEVYSIR